MHRRRVVRRKRTGQLTRVKRRIQRAKPVHKQVGLAQCDECPYAAMDNRGLAAHKRFKHGRKPGQALTGSLKVPPKFKGGDGGDGSKVSYEVPGPKSSTLTAYEALDKLIQEKEGLLALTKHEIMNLQDMKDSIKQMAGVKK